LGDIEKHIVKGTCWAFIPARGGSKSIPLKNIHPLAGHPLMDYCARCALVADVVDRVICSTDSDRIAEHCRQLGVDVHDRPTELSGDSVQVADVFVHFLNDILEKEGSLPEFIVFLQPTSPFILPEHIEESLNTLKRDSGACSVQTVVQCPHQQHAINQRVIEDGFVSFAYRDEQVRMYNKQLKKDHFLFGNLILVRTVSAIAQHKVFTEPSVPVLIDHVFGIDVDGPLEFPLAEFLLKHGYLTLPFIQD